MVCSPFDLVPFKVEYFGAHTFLRTVGSCHRSGIPSFQVERFSSPATLLPSLVLSLPPPLPLPLPLLLSKAVGILSQGSQFGAYVMGISTAKTILAAPTEDLEPILTAGPLIRMWKEAWVAHVAAGGARAAAAKADSAGAFKTATTSGGGEA